MLLTNLPNELLSNIALQLDGLTEQLDLRQLALVCRALRPIAQEALLRSPAFRYQYDDIIRSRIILFARTLAKRPDIAQKVKQLTIRLTLIQTCKDWLLGS
ncbi:hypothetical protein EJ02DRAFT_195594 [Clathrospora elynae]|uniref:F-box domain-containing protein n=1 Tax=Clathrospora elynae TaxID=706981 RepID=A0A6A5SPQ4_9PLEO|nr:hypothetical protein EJ02DRAFT_195594 [Clathrospora elynae]